MVQQQLRCAVLALLWASQGCVSEGSHAFQSNAVFDTVVSVGYDDEANALLIYEVPTGAQLVDDTLVLFADSRGGRLAAVNPETGLGWQVHDDGASGPGEFGGTTPWFSESNGRIFTATVAKQASTRSLSGDLLSSGTYQQFVHDELQRRITPVGFVDSGIAVAHFWDGYDRETEGRQELRQGVFAYSYDGKVWTFDDVPPIVAWIETYEEGKTRTRDSQGQVMVDARHGTVVLTSNGAPWIMALDADGAVRRRVEIDGAVFSAFIDADERIWVQTWARNDRSSGSYIVFDRNLNVMDSLVASSVYDASGDRILTLSSDARTGTSLIHILRRRRAGGRPLSRRGLPTSLRPPSAGG